MRRLALVLAACLSIVALAAASPVERGPEAAATPAPSLLRAEIAPAHAPPAGPLAAPGGLPAPTVGAAAESTAAQPPAAQPGAAFYQDGPKLGNQYDEDRMLRSYLKRRLPPAMLAEIEGELRRLGARAVGEILEQGQLAENETHLPRHVPYDAWGRRVDRIEVSKGWENLHRIAAEEGLIATGYERKHGALSRIDQFARIYLYSPSSAFYACPLAMTDGAARALELFGDDALKATALKRLLSRAPEEFWTSGQWMTERTGGSDVGETSTVARKDGGSYRLHGLKWFTSATTSPMAMVLARVEGAPAGSRGLSLFYVELRDAAGRLKDIVVNRLKEKLGTRALPTAELELKGTPAVLVGGEGNGVRKIAALFNVTRVHNAFSAVSMMRRGIALARDYAAKRVAFGKPLAEHPLHRETLASMQVEFEAAFLLAFHTADLLGKQEVGEATPREAATLRLLTTLAKLYTARQALPVVSEALESFGAAGYMEDTGLAKFLRDVQVFSIWEGTTNVLSLDVMRAMTKERALAPFLEDARLRAESARRPELSAAVDKVAAAVSELSAYAAASASGPFLEDGARAFAFSLARTYAASLMLEHAAWSLDAEGDRRGVISASRWCAQELVSLVRRDAASRADSRALALDEPAPKP